MKDPGIVKDRAFWTTAHRELQLDGIVIQQLRNGILNLIAASTAVSFRVSSSMIELETRSGAIVGKLNARYSKMIQVLHAEPSVQLQAFTTPITSNSGTSHPCRTKRGGKQLAESQNNTFALSVILYGTMDKFDDIGDFFSQCSEYLQSPLRCDRNVPYRNPQSLCGREENPPMMNQFQARLSSSEIETLAQTADPSAELETKKVYHESEPPAAVRTPLYR